MLPTHDVPCPRCGKTLYSATSLEDAVVAATPESPKIERDERGYFMCCPNCRSRIAMQRVESAAAAAWRPRA